MTLPSDPLILGADRTIPCPGCGSWQYKVMKGTVQTDDGCMEESWCVHRCPDCHWEDDSGDDHQTISTTPGYRELWAEIERLREGGAA